MLSGLLRFHSTHLLTILEPFHGLPKWVLHYFPCMNYPRGLSKWVLHYFPGMNYPRGLSKWVLYDAQCNICPSLSKNQASGDSQIGFMMDSRSVYGESSIETDLNQFSVFFRISKNNSIKWTGQPMLDWSYSVLTLVTNHFSSNSWPLFFAQFCGMWLPCFLSGPKWFARGYPVFARRRQGAEVTAARPGRREQRSAQCRGWRFLRILWRWRGCHNSRCWRVQSRLHTTHNSTCTWSVCLIVIYSCINMGVSMVDSTLQVGGLRDPQRLPYSLKALCDFLLHNNHLHGISSV